MPVPTAWRAQQTSGSTGTGPFNLNAAEGSRRAWQAVLGSSPTAAAALISQSGSSSWVIATGTYDGGSPGTFTVGTVLSSSNGGSAVSWGAGRKDVILLTLPGQRNRVAVTGSATAVLADLGCLLDYTGAGGHTLTLPAAASVPAGVGYLIRNSGSSGAVLTVDGNASELVGLAASQLLFRGEAMELWSTGTGWIHSPLPAVGLVATQALTVVAAVDFVLPSASFTYEFAVNSIVLSSAAYLALRTSSDGGANFDAGGSDYGRSLIYITGANTRDGNNDSGSEIYLSTTGPINNAVYARGEFYPGDGAYGARVIRCGSYSLGSGGSVTNSGTFHGNRVATGAANAIRFRPSTGNFAAAGSISLYARRV